MSAHRSVRVTAPVWGGSIQRIYSKEFQTKIEQRVLGGEESGGSTVQFNMRKIKRKSKRKASRSAICHTTVQGWEWPFITIHEQNIHLIRNCCQHTVWFGRHLRLVFAGSLEREKSKFTSKSIVDISAQRFTLVRDKQTHLNQLGCQEAIKS